MNAQQFLQETREHGITRDLLRRVGRGEKAATRQFKSFLRAMGHDPSEKAAQRQISGMERES